MSDKYPKHMMATKANHKMGDLSREEPQLVIIGRENPETGEYVGNWVSGFGFFDVHFPKETTRELSRAEVLYYEGRDLRIGSMQRPMKIVGYDHIERPERERPSLKDVADRHLDGPLTADQQMQEWIVAKTEGPEQSL
jgi:hypothetical protein